MKSTKLCAFSLSLLFSAAMATAADTAGNFFDENGAYYGPDCDKEKNYSGAYYTGNYESPFKTVLGKTDEEIQKKMDDLWNHYFKGDNNSKVYYDKGNEAYIKDINNNDVRSGYLYDMETFDDVKKAFEKLTKYYMDWSVTLNNYAENATYIPTQNLFGAYLTLKYGYTITDVDDADRTETVYTPDSIFINNQARLNQNGRK